MRKTLLLSALAALLLPSVLGAETNGSMKMKLLLPAFEIGFTDFVSSDYSMYPAEDKGFMDIGSKSIHIAGHFIRGRQPLNRSSKLGLNFGLGLAWDNYVFSNDITLAKNDGQIYPVGIDSKYKKSKLTTFALNVPLVLDVTLNKFSFAGGVYGNVILSQHTKYKKPKHKDKGLGYMNMFQGGVTVRVGFKCVSIFANYQLTEFFKSSIGPDVHPLTVGVGLW